MEVKILCNCGTKYAFPVEVENGQMIGMVACPNCQADGTDAANESVRVQLEALGQSAPVVETPPAPPEPPTTPTSGSPLRVKAVASKPATVHAETAPASSPPVASATASHSQRAPKKKERAYGEPNMTLGLVAAIGSGFVTMMIWYFLIASTGWAFGIVAWIIGVAIGFACRTFSGGFSNTLGVVCAISAFISILGGQFLAGKAIVRNAMYAEMEPMYQEELAFAERARTIESDDEIRAFLANDWTERMEEFRTEALADEELRSISQELLASEPETYTVDDVTDEDIAEFRDRKATAIALADGTMSKEEFYEDMEEFMQMVVDSLGGDFAIMKESVGLMGLLFIFFGVASAWKLGSGQSE